MKDELILELFWKRDEVAIQKTQEKYEDYLIKVAYNILADIEDSKEAVNDTYLAAWNSIPPNHPSVLSTYLSDVLITREDGTPFITTLGIFIDKIADMDYREELLKELVPLQMGEQDGGMGGMSM